MAWKKLFCYVSADAHRPVVFQVLARVQHLEQDMDWVMSLRTLWSCFVFPALLSKARVNGTR